MEILLNTLNSPLYLDCISRIENNFNLSWFFRSLFIHEVLRNSSELV